MHILASLPSVITAYNSDSHWLPHVQTVIKHYQVHTLQNTLIPAPMPSGSALRPSDPSFYGRFAPPHHLATLALSPGRVSEIKCPAKASTSRSALAVSFNFNGSHSTVSGISTTYGHVIVHGNPASTGLNAENSDSGSLFGPSDIEE